MDDSIRKAGKDVPDHPAEFQKVFCVYCRNPDCEHACWAVDKFSARIVTQPNRFFNPTQTDPNNPQFAHLEDFMEMTKEVLRVHMANQDDWDVEVPITDGVDQTASKGTTNAIDAAAKILAKSKNKELDIPEPENKIEDTFPDLSIEDSNFNEVPVEDIPVEDIPVKDIPVKDIPEPVAEPMKTSSPNQGNTELKHGIMIGGGDPSENIPDDWAPPSPGTEKKVEPGARIIMGGKGNTK